MPMIYSRLGSGKEAMTEFVQLSMQVLQKFTGSGPSSTPTAQLVLLECYSLLSIVLPSFRDLELDLAEEEGSEMTTISSVYPEAIKTTTQSMEQCLDRIWDLSKTNSFMTEINGGQAKTVLWLLITMTLEEGSRVNAVLTILLNWFNTHRGKRNHISMYLIFRLFSPLF